MIETKSRNQKLFFIIADFLIPLVILTIATAIFINSNLDIEISSFFFNPELPKGFNKEAVPWIYFYDYGMAPAWLSIAVSLVCLAMSFLKDKYKKLRRNSIFVILFFALGPGLAVNGIFKEITDRPRPVNCSIFKGKYEYKKVLSSWGVNTKNKSFPSGHAAGAFAMIFPYFILRNKNKVLAYLALAGGSIYGIIIGYARIAQGGHFASDVLWSFGIVYLTGLILYYALKRQTGHS